MLNAPVTLEKLGMSGITVSEEIEGFLCLYRASCTEFLFQPTFFVLTIFLLLSLVHVWIHLYHPQ